MILRFNLAKTIEAVGVILKEHDHRASRLRLLKLLYIADRERLEQSGRTITGDHPCAMEHGPVLTRTYDLIKGTSTDQEVWDRYFARHPYGGHEVMLIDSPGVGVLSRHEVEKLVNVCRRYEGVSEWDLSRYTHIFPEWQRAYSNRHCDRTSVRISDEALLEAVGRGQDKTRLLNESASEDEWAAMLESLEGGGGEAG